MKRTAIIILNWNGSDETIRCVNSLHPDILNDSTVYVIDNNSTPEQKNTLIDGCQDVEIVMNRNNYGYAGGNNIGIRKALHSGHEFVLLLNNDAGIRREDYFLLRKDMDDFPELQIIGPVLYDSQTGAILNCGGKDIGFFYISHHKTIVNPEDIYAVDYVSGTICLIRCSLFEHVGLLDENYFFSGEIADFCKRTARTRLPSGASCRVAVDPKASGTHNLAPSHHNRGNIYTYYTVRNRFLYIRKHLRPHMLKLFWFWGKKHLGHARNCIREKKYTELKMVIKGLVHGLVGRYGPHKKLS